MAETLGDRLGNIEAEALHDALATTLPGVESETLRNTLSDVMTGELINALAGLVA